MALTKTPIELSSTPSIVDGGNATAITIDASGTIKSSVNGAVANLILENDADTPYVAFTESGAAQFYIGESSIIGGGGGYDIYAAANQGITFFTNALRRVDIDSSGNVGIGTVPSAWGSFYSAIDAGSAGNQAFFVGQTNAPVMNLGVNLYNDNTNWRYAATAKATFYQQYVGEHRWFNAVSGTAGAVATTVQAMTLDASGMLAVPAWYTNTTALGATAYIATGPQGAIYRSTSSIKYKRDVETIEDIYADALLDVRPVFYRSKSDNDNSAHGFWGIIAEELAEIDPRLVHWQTHVPVEVTDADGVVTTEMVELDTPEAEGVQYERFVPLLINLAKRQQDQITAQAAAITDLTTRLTALENN